MSSKKVREHLSLAITIAVLLAVSIKSFISFDDPNDSFSKLLAQFYGLTIFLLIIAYIVVDSFNYPAKPNRIYEYVVKFDLFLMGLVLIVVILTDIMIEVNNAAKVIGIIMATNYLIPSFIVSTAFGYTNFHLNKLIHFCKMIPSNVLTYLLFIFIAIWPYLSFLPQMKILTGIFHFLAGLVMALYCITLLYVYTRHY